MEITYIIIGLAALSILSLILYFIFRPSSPKRTTESLYSDGLRLLLEGDLKAASEKLKEVVRRDTGHIDAYIKLGDIFRENGQYDQALKVHQSLTVRRNLTPGQQVDIYLSMVYDHRELNAYEKALEFADKILTIDKKNLKGLNAKLEIYRENDLWDNAVDVLKAIEKYSGEDQSKAIATYRVAEGQLLEETGEAREGRIRYRKALKLDPECCPAFICLGNSYDEENRIEEAVDNWQKFGELCPDLLFLVSGRIEQRLFELGNFSEVERYYRRLLDKYPDNIEAAVGIATFYEKKGENQNAIRAIENALDKSPDSLRARIVLTRLYNQGENRDGVAEQLEEMFRIESQQKTFTCGECGFQSREMHWLCPNCYATYSFTDDQV
ncbi:MAG: tetratricopeptide repeat protein [Candidatus Marinimicrobia bacterium]|nr:tetratricopeptide repeat protein [Candidatus Neomarinimicrobiota bacterium]MCF7828931.1 tetratricopeptide repeat protein [Candidatus Neomarinimicrobiota bacterium]MCF7879891.1 tetratricopeptide repeat protein [Candidatus Neomarinimicrobiota bacterium]